MSNKDKILESSEADGYRKEDQKGFGLKNVVRFFGSIYEDREDMLNEFMKVLEFGYSQKERPPIYILIDSDGGELEFAFSLYNLISSYPGKTIGIVVGKSHSAANIIFAACEKRYSLPYSRFLFHSMFSKVSVRTNNSNLLEIADSLHESLKDSHKRAVQIHVNAGIPEIDFEMMAKKGDIVGREYFPDQLLKYGFVQEVITKIPF